MVAKTLSIGMILFIVLIVILFFVFLNVLIRVALFVVLILGVIWLWRHLQKPKSRRR